MTLERVLEMEFLGNTVGDWALALAAFLVTFLLLPLLKRYIGARQRRLAATPQASALEVAMRVAVRTTRLFLVGVAVWVGSTLLSLPARIDRVIGGLMLVIVWFQVGVWTMTAVTSLIDRQRQGTTDRGYAGSLDLIGFIARVVIWALVLLVALDNLDIHVTPLIAGLGIGGIAVALAVQTLLGDLLASLSITLDKPFVIGDFLVVDKDMGTVENIGIKSTRLRSIDGEQIIVSNADLLKSRVHNFGRLYERRVLFTTEVRYETPRDRVQQVISILEAAVRAQEKTRFERCHFARFGDFALVFETVYHVLDADYKRYMDIQQAINFRILEEFERLGVLFAYRERLPLPLPQMLTPPAPTK